MRVSCEKIKTWQECVFVALQAFRQLVCSFLFGCIFAFKKPRILRSRIQENQFKNVTKTCLFLQLVFEGVWPPFWEGLGKVLGRFWGRFGASWPLLGGLLALFLATLSLKRAQERPKRAQEAPKRVQELDCGGFWGGFWKDLAGVGEGFGKLLTGLETSWSLDCFFRF